MPTSAQSPLGDSLFDVSKPLSSRAITAENPKGEPGAGGKAASRLGPGRKGSPTASLKAGSTYELCDIQGPGTIRHIWMTSRWTGKDRKTPLLRSVVVRAYWDGQEHPSIECPLGDFMGFAHSFPTAYQSHVHSIGEKAALNFWLPMPFAKSARITLTNDSKEDIRLFYQVDYTVGDEHKDDIGRLHVLFRRSNPTTLKQDFELLPKRTGRGRFVGAVMGVRTLHPGWWGEGEVKAYLDGDTDHPTICGTGSEDYVGLSYGIQRTTYMHHGCSLIKNGKSKVKATELPSGKEVTMPHRFISMYRWHLADPIYWKKECRITIQQIGCCYYERDDDWSTASFWYEPTPSQPLPAMPSFKQRVADLGDLY